MGTLLILSDQYAEELRNDGRLGVYEAVKDVCFASALNM